MSKLPLDYLQHILDECEYIVSTIKAETKKEDLLTNELHKGE